MFLEDYVVGERYALPPITITKQEMTAFASAYDPLPVHLDEAYAETTHFGGLVAPGAMSFLKVWGAFAGRNIWGDEMLGGMNTRIDWLLPVYAGDVLTARAEITAVTRRNDRSGVVGVTIEVFNQAKALTMRNVTETMVKARGPKMPDGR